MVSSVDRDVHRDVDRLDRDPDDGDRLEELYVRFAPGGIRLAYLMTGDRGVAEDLVQEAFVRFVGRLHSLRDPNAFEAYLRRTVINLSKNHYRRRAVERADLERQASFPPQTHEERDVSEYEAMRRALLELPARQRAAIVLRYYEDLPEAQIAEVLRCRPATVRSLISRGLAALRQSPEVIR
jgi:RNA polymerase sigma-70 factor (sigma-E family)